LSKEVAILTGALYAVHTRVPIITRYVIKARVGHLSARQAQLDQAIENARALHDELITARTALGWSKRERSEA
jgi:hypothetical protein